MKFHAKLARLVDGQRLSGNEIARDLAIDQSHFHKMIQGKRRASLPNRLKIARYFGVSLEWLVDDAMTDPPAAAEAVDPIILDLLGRLDRDEAIRRLAAVPASRADGVDAGPQRTIPGVKTIQVPPTPRADVTGRSGSA